MPYDIARCKQHLREELLKKCDHGFYKWLDPDVSKTRLCVQEWCRPTVAMSSFAFRVQRALATTPSEDYLPTQDLLLHEVPSTDAWVWYQLATYVMSCLSTEDLVDMILSSTNIMPLHLRCGVLLRHIIRIIICREETAELPAVVHDVPLANAVALLGGAVSEIESIANHGHLLQFPVAPTEEWSQVYTRGYTDLTDNTVAYLINKSGSVYPFGKTLDELLSRHRYMHMNVTYTLAYSGKYPVSKSAFLALVGSGIFREDVMDTTRFLPWLRNNIKNYTITTDDIDTMIMCWGCSAYISFEGVKVLTETLGSNFTTVFCDALFEDDDEGYRRNGLPHFHFESFMLYLFASGMLPSKPRSFWENLVFYDQEHIDSRVVDYVCATTSRSKPHVLATNPPIFSKSHDLLVQFNDEIRAHVYSEYITKHSPVINVLVEGHGFKQVLTSCGPQKLLVLQTGLPEALVNPEEAVNAWVTFCYTRAVKPSATVEDVVDLRTIADYLQDQDCVVMCSEWMEHEYMSNEDHHANWFNEHIQSCVVCTHWIS